MENEPPPAPSAFHDLGWHGLRLRLPAEWNLSAFHGTAWKGSLTVSDLRGPQLIARWHKPRRWPQQSDVAPRQFHKLSTTLRRRQPTAKFAAIADNAIQIDLASGERLLLAHDHERLFELHWPEKPVENDSLAAAFLQALGEPALQWKWQAFGISDCAPAYARIRSARLRPGAPEITLVSHSTAITLGALSLADRLLGNSTLRAAAEKHLQLNHLPGEWKDNGFALLFNGRLRRRFLPGRINFGFHILHDTAANQIRWHLTTTPGFHRIWRS